MPPPSEPDAVASTSADATYVQPDAPSETQAGPPTPPDGPPGPHPATLGGYRVERLLGEGGMGAVYLARDDKLDRAVALKTMRPEIAAQPGAVARFLREARAAAKVAHDNIIPILHIGEDAGTPYIVMPLLEGEPLNEFLRRVPVCPVAVVLKVGRETADGLAAAHARGLVHRDIKPANIWIEGDATSSDLAARFRRVKVLDFGLARPANDDTQLTGTGAVLGTPAYMSPEQGRGQPVDFRTDLFSLGVVLYRMTTGVAPFTGANTMAILTSLAVDHPPPPVEKNPQVPPALSALIMQLLAKDRDARPKSTAEVAAALREIGRQVVAARQAAEAGPLPVVVAYPQPLAQPVAPEFNPFTELDASLPPPAEAVPEATAAEPRAVPRPPAKKPRGAGAWVAAGLASLVAVAAVVFAVVKLTGPKDKGPTPSPNEVTKDEPKPPPKLPKDKGGVPAPSTDPDRKAAEWALSLGGTVSVKDGAGEREVTAAKDLPAGPFTVTGLNFANARDAVTDADLGRLNGLTGLAILYVHNSNVSDAGLSHLAGLSGLRQLYFGGSSQISDAGVAQLARLTGLTHVALSGAPVTDAGLAHLKGLPALANLNLQGSKVTDAGLEHLTGMSQLTMLILNTTKVTAPGVAKLAKALPHCKITSDHGTIEPVGDRPAAEWVLSVGGKVTLKVGAGEKSFAAATDLPAGPFAIIDINLANCDKVADGDLARFHGLTLRGISLEKTKVTDAGLAHLKGVKGLAVLLLGNTKVTDAGFVHLKDHKSLTELEVGSTSVTGAGFVHLKELPKLSSLSCYYCFGVKDSALAHLKELKQLTNLQLGATGMTDAGLVHLKEMKGLTVLLVGPEITNDGLIHLKEATELVSLSLRNTKVTGVGLAHLAGLPKLATLGLSETGITDTDLEHLKGFKALTKLHLNTTGVTDAGLERLAGLNGLTLLEVTKTKVTAAGVEKLQKALPNCKIEWTPPKP